MFVYDDETQSYYCDEYQFYGLESITLADIVRMLEQGQLDQGGFMKLTDEQRDDIIQVASGHYLCESLPDNWRDMDNDEDNEFNLYEFCSDNAWEPFQYWEGKELFECIDAAAYSTVRYIEYNL